MSERWFTSALAAFIWRWRRPMSLVIVLGALALAPRANVTRIDNDITAWFSKEDPVYQDYERFRQEFGGTRTLIVGCPLAICTTTPSCWLTSCAAARAAPACFSSSSAC